MGLLEGFGPRTIEQFRTLEGSIKLLNEIHQKLPQRRVSDREEINELYHRGALLVGETNLNSVFIGINDEAARTLVAQVVIAFFVWDPLSLFAPGLDATEFEEFTAAGVAKMEVAERMSEIVGKNALLILKDTQPPIVFSHALFCSLLRIARRPLAFLYPTQKFRTMLAEGMHPLLPLDATIRERHATALHPQSREPWPHELLLQCPPIPPHPGEVDGTIPPPMIDLLRFTPEDVFASFACGERVLEHVRTNWNWQMLDEFPGKHIN